METSADKIRFFKKIPFIAYVAFFAATIMLLFAFGLTLDISSIDKAGTDFGTALFTSVSAFCLNGLSLVDGAEHWSGTGLCLVLLCMQLGGLTVIALSTALFLRIGSFIYVKLGKKDALLNVNDKKSTKKFLLYLCCYVFIIEFAGALLLLGVFVPAFGWGRGTFYSLFSSVSAFTGCGMRVLSEGSAFVFTSNTLYNIVTFLLILLGGAGFALSADVISSGKITKASFNTKMIAIAFLALTFLCSLVFFAVEFSNPASIGSMPLYNKVASSLNYSQSIRAAQLTGFNFSGFTRAGKVLSCVMMFIGACPASFSGGLKLGVIVIFMVYMFKFALGKSEPDIFGYAIPQKVFNKSAFVIFISFIWVFVSSFLLVATQPFDYFTLVFESVSSFTLSGATLGTVVNMDIFGKGLILTNMLIGRFGTLYLFYLLDTNILKASKVSVIKTKSANFMV